MRSAALCVLALLLVATTPHEPEATARSVAEFLNERERAQQASRTATLTLIDANGQRRERRLKSFWKLEPDARRLVYFALSPPEMKHMAFLAHDYFDASRSDDQWFYKPARKRAQRIASPRRSESFLGSEFSFEDMKKEDRVEVGEYNWEGLETATLDGKTFWKLQQRPATPQLAKDLGYGRIVNWVDPDTAMRRRIEFFDLKDAPLKTFEIGDLEEVDGFWTARRIEATNHQTGHRSLLVFSQIDYASPVADDTFTPRTLEAERSERLGPRAP